jgi:CheY-like chemotaxis protein
VFRLGGSALPKDDETLETLKVVSQESPLADRTILICDDSDLTRKMLKKVLLSMGCKHCYEAKNGLEAVKMTEDRLKTGELCSSYDVLTAFDLILLDSHMPVMQGPEAARRIRELGFVNPIIGVTGDLASEGVDSFMSSGVNAVLSKPLEMSELVRILQQSESEQEDKI